MSNSIAPGSSADVNVRVTALTTNPNVPVTYKTIILKKNLVNGVNTLTQEMMSATNTKYVVKYDYVLGEDIVVPNNCILEFDGGSIDCSNHVINGDKMPTYVVYTPEQFGAGKSSDDTKPIQSALNLCHNIRMDGDYNVYSPTSYPSSDNYVLSVSSNTTIYLNGTVSYKTTELDRYSIFTILNCENVSIISTGTVIGDKEIHVGSTGEHGIGICIEYSNNINIKGGEYKNFWGDAIYIGYRTPASKNVTISDLNIDNARRNGISVGCAENISISNLTIANVSGTNPKAAIDIEPAIASSYVKNLYIDNIVIYNCTNGIVLQDTSGDTSVPNKITNAFISNVTAQIPIYSLLGFGCHVSKFVGGVNIQGYAYIDNSELFINIFNDSYDLLEKVYINNSRIYRLSTDAVKPIGIDFNNCTFIFDSTNIFRNANGSELYFNGCKVTFKAEIEGQYQVIGVNMENCDIDCYDVPYIRGKMTDCRITAGLKGADSRIFVNRSLVMYRCFINITGTRSIPLYYLQAGYSDIINVGSIVNDVISRTKIDDHSSGAFTVKDAGTIYLLNNELQS